MTNKKRTWLADFALLIVAFIWGGGFIAADIALHTLNPFQLLGLRFLPPGIILCIIFYKKLKQASGNDIFSGFILGLFLFAGMTLQTIGLKYTTPGKQAFLVATYTVMVPFVSWVIMKKRPSIQSILCGLLTLFGVALLSLNEQLKLGIGDILSLFFALVFAMQIVLTGKFARSISPFVLTPIQLLTAGGLSSIGSLIIKTEPIVFNTDLILSLGYLILLNTALAFLLQNIAQKHTSDTHASIIISLESIFGSLLAILLLGETFTTKMILGGLLIFTSVILSKVSFKDRNQSSIESYTMNN